MLQNWISKKLSVFLFLYSLIFLFLLFTRNLHGFHNSSHTKCYMLPILSNFFICFSPSRPTDKMRAFDNSSIGAYQLQRIKISSRAFSAHQFNVDMVKRLSTQQTSDSTRSVYPFKATVSVLANFLYGFEISRTYFMKVLFSFLSGVQLLKGGHQGPIVLM